LQLKRFTLNIFKTITIAVFCIMQTYPQGLNNKAAEQFINLLINDSPELEKLVLPQELNSAHRLGIEFPEAKNKFIAANDFDPSVKNDLKQGRIKYEYKIEPVTGDYAKLIISVPSKNLQKEYLFYKSQLVSNEYYYCANWINKKSKYFSFKVSDAALINDYSIKQLDKFVDGILSLLEFSSEEIKNLSEQKTIYYLCRDEDEMEKLTGYKAKGLYDVSYDCIISTYNCHLHELLHLLINYKFSRIDLYTNPFLQEGFAVAFGGRGGLEKDVVNQTGLFMLKNNFLDVKSLFGKNGFLQQDASIAYPAAGIYTKFLVKYLGVKKYLQLYKNYSGSAEFVSGADISSADLPPDSCWISYLNHPDIDNYIDIGGGQTNNYKNIAKTENYCIDENDDNYFFKLKNTIGVTSPEENPEYSSKQFIELFPGKIYKRQKYIIKADSSEISVYNLLTNNLIAKYSAGLSLENSPVIKKDGFYLFAIKKRLFDEPITLQNIVEVN